MHHVIVSEYYAHGEDSRRTKSAVVNAGVSLHIQIAETYPVISLYTDSVCRQITGNVGAPRLSDCFLIAFIHFNLPLSHEMDIVTIDLLEVVYSRRNSFPRDCFDVTRGSFGREMRRGCDVRRRRTNESTSPGGGGAS